MEENKEMMKESSVTSQTTSEALADIVIGEDMYSEKVPAEKLCEDLSSSDFGFSEKVIGSADNPVGDTVQQISEKEKKPSALVRFLSVIVSTFFCASSLIYCVTGAVSSIEDISESGIEKAVEHEVYGSGTEEKKRTESIEGEKSEKIVEGGKDAAEEPSAVYCIKDENLSSDEPMTKMSNVTSYTPDLEKLFSEQKNVGLCDKIYKEYGEDAPVVLIVHTHGTEAYSGGGDTYTEDEPFRSQNTNENVVAVGEVMASVMRSEGINVIHCTEMFDLESYRDSYSRSYAAVSQYLKDNPSIKYVFDVHRDSVIRDDMTMIRTNAEYGGEKIAQAMIVVGTDEGGADHPDWKDHLSFALSIQNSMLSLSDTLPRRINLRDAAFNQALAPGALLFEIGSCGNTLGQAEKCAALCAYAASESILGKEPPISADELIASFASDDG